MPILGIWASSISGNLITNSYVSLATSTVGSGGSSSITFSSIPTTYTHLQIRSIGRIDQANTDDNVYFRFNGDSGANYAGHYFFGTGANPAVGAAATGQTQGVACRTTGGSSGANMFGIGVCDILDYRNTNKNKTVRVLTGHDQNGSGLTFLMSTLWQNTSAVTSITLFTLAGNFTQYSQFALYGIKGA